MFTWRYNIFFQRSEMFNCNLWFISPVLLLYVPIVTFSKWYHVATCQGSLRHSVTWSSPSHDDDFVEFLLRRWSRIFGYKAGMRSFRRMQIASPNKFNEVIAKDALTKATRKRNSCMERTCYFKVVPPKYLLNLSYLYIWNYFDIYSNHSRK